MSQKGLYVVATPIGNLEDISYRAVRVLAEVDLIAAEDTRHSRQLLVHYGIATALQAFHEHNEERMTDRLLQRISDGAAIALISDAGTPLISDPGFRLVVAARKQELPVYSLPGPSALTAALSVAGIATDRFVFEGFLPSRGTARKKKLGSLAVEPRTMVFFESRHRIALAIADLIEVFGPQRSAALCRELTKKFETVLRASLEEIRQRMIQDQNQLRGEFVIVVSGYQGNNEEALSRAQFMATALLEYLPTSQAARIAAKLNDVPRREVYRFLSKSEIP
jgi:16S rRNA (cytidine1402-2'-O)-methyltransferase